MPVKMLTLLGAALLTTQAAAQVVTFEGLLEELNDRAALARLPDPAYTCKQFSSYDRASKAPGDDSWFANADAGQFIRVDKINGRDEYVMMDAAGPGAVVRIWSANPKGTLRVYIDNQPRPMVEGPMGRMLDAGGLAPSPLAGVRSRGYNLYLPIPYAQRCVITSDEPGFYYQVNYRTYQPGTVVASFGPGTPIESARAIQEAASELTASRWVEGLSPAWEAKVPAGKSFEKTLNTPGQAIDSLTLSIDEPGDWERALRSLVLEIEFDGQSTVWAPVGDFFGSGIGLHETSDRVRWVRENGLMACGWIMPFQRQAVIRLHNLGTEDLKCSLGARTTAWTWDDRSMHFAATWREQRDIATRPMKDWNYVTISGPGVFVGDTLTVTNPVEQWWGEGDEKIYVDGETFPSHFGTGTEDYYGYAWCCPEPFQSPLHAQVRCDGYAYNNNYGTSTVARLRSLDAVPFEKSFRFDMEVWHWADTKVSQSAVAYFYARPGTTANVKPDRSSASLAPPQAPELPPPLVIEGAIEAETLDVVGKSEGVQVGPQGGFGPYLWSRGQHLWVRAAKVGDYVEIKVPASGAGPERLFVHLTKSWDYATVRVGVNGREVASGIDLFNTAGREVAATGAIDLGTHEPKYHGYVVRFEVTGTNAKADKPGTYFGIDCFERRRAD